MQPITIIEETPGVDEFVALREAAGLSHRTSEAARMGLPGSLFAVCAAKKVCHCEPFPSSLRTCFGEAVS
jgi:hypothetical protein